jgi:hypothetical protein
MIRNFLFCITIASLLYSMEPSQKTNVAVMNLRGEGTVTDAVSILSDRLRNELFNTGRFIVMERGEMDNILKEQGFQQSGACDDKSCMVEAGQLLGVDKIIAGSIGQIGSKFLINLRIIDVRTGQMLDTYSGECLCPVEDLAGAMKTAANSLGNKNTEPQITAEEKKNIAPQTTRHKIGFSAYNYNLDSELNKFIDFIGSDYPFFTCTLAVDPDKKAFFSTTTGFSLLYEYAINGKIHLKAEFGTIRQDIDLKYDIIRKPPLLTDPENAGKLDLNTSMIMIPFRVGASWMFIEKGRFQLRALMSLALTTLFYTADFNGEYEWTDAYSVNRKDSIGSWLDMNTKSVSFGTGIEGIFRLTKRFQVGIHAGLEITKFSSLSGNGNMDALNKIIFDDRVNPRGLPNDQETPSKYELVEFSTSDNKQWNYFRKENSDGTDLLSTMPRVTKSTLSINTSKAGLSLYFNF